MEEQEEEHNGPERERGDGLGGRGVAEMVCTCAHVDTQAEFEEHIAARVLDRFEGTVAATAQEQT